MLRKIVIFLFLLVLVLSSNWANCYASGDDKLDLVEMFPDKNTEIAANMRQARHFMEKGDYVSAKKKLERVLELDGEHAEALRLLEECNEQIKQQVQAERDALNQAIEAGTVQALRDFITQYPKSDFVNQAEDCIVDFELWDDARKNDTKAAYQKYLSASTILGYKDAAEAAILRIEEEEAWSSCHNSNSMPKLESFLEAYPQSRYAKEAEFELDLLYADNYYKQNLRSKALSYYRMAEKIHALTGDHYRQYSELLLEEQYNKLKNSNDVAALQNLLRTLSSNSPYYNPISNRIAIIKAQRLTVSSSENDMNDALGYAMDDSTEASVKQYISEVKKRQRENRRQLKRWKRKAWWEDRATLGWNIVSADVDPEFEIRLDNASGYPSTCALGTGLRFRFGRYDDIINFTIGMDYQNYWGKHVTPTSYYYYNEEEVEYNTIYRRLAFPVNLKLNMPSERSSRAFYFGCTAEFGFDYNHVLNYFRQINSFENLLNWPAVSSIAVEPQIGFNHKHFDWGLYYRYYLNGHRFFNTEYSVGNKRFGLFMTVYF